jgi:spore maturation protein B
MDWKIISSVFSNWLFLLFIGGIPLVGYLRKVNVFESFALGAKDGFEIIVRIIPYLVGIIVGVGMFRAAGGFDWMAQALNPVLHFLGFPAELLPLALIRPFSGTAAKGVLAEIAHANGGHSFLAHAAATMMGSTETTFYVIAIYFGAVSIRRTRYAIASGLLADFVGVIVAVLVTHWFYY